MKLRAPYELPEDKERALSRAKRLEWWTLFFLATIVAAMYLAMGGSQAMKTAWIEDVLSMVPPVLFLVALRQRRRDPDAWYPYGRRRVVLLAFLGASAAVVLVGLFVLYDGATALLAAERPTIGTMRLPSWLPFGAGGRDVWAGWVMVAALVYSVVPPVVLGRMKLRLAEEVHEKVLHADAAMNKADWMTGAAAAAGVVGVGLGIWWADAAAAVAISADVIWDGARNLRRALADLTDQRPTTIEGDRADDLPDRLRALLLGFDWVEDADVRLREEGHVVSGEAFVVPRAEGLEGGALVDRLGEAAEALAAADWRVYEVVVVPVRSLAPQAFVDPEDEGSE